MKKIFAFILLVLFAVTPAWALTDLPIPTSDSIIFYDVSASDNAWLTPGTGLTISGTELAVTGILDDIQGLTPDTDASIIYWSGSAWSLAKSLDIDIVLADEAPTTSGQITYDATNDALRVYDGAAVDTWSNDANIATVSTIDASGFDGNLSTTDDTIQEVAQKLDDLPTGGGGGTVNVSVDTDAEITLDDAACTMGLRVNGDADDISYQLPSATAGLNVELYDRYPNVVSVWPATGESIVLDGTALTAGNGLASPAEAGAFVRLVAIGGSWLAMQKQGTWVDAGAPAPPAGSACIGYCSDCTLTGCVPPDSYTLNNHTLVLRKFTVDAGTAGVANTIAEYFKYDSSQQAAGDRVVLYRYDSGSGNLVLIGQASITAQQDTWVWGDSLVVEDSQSLTLTEGDEIFFGIYSVYESGKAKSAARTTGGGVDAWYINSSISSGGAPVTVPLTDFDSYTNQLAVQLRITQ